MTATERLPLTVRQREYVRVIVGYIRDRGVSPTMREIGDALGVASLNGVHAQLEALARKGWVVYERTVGGHGRGKARTVTVPELAAALRAAAVAYLDELEASA